MPPSTTPLSAPLAQEVREAHCQIVKDLTRAAGCQLQPQPDAHCQALYRSYSSVCAAPPPPTPPYGRSSP